MKINLTRLPLLQFNLVCLMGLHKQQGQPPISWVGAAINFFRTTDMKIARS